MRNKIKKILSMVLIGIMVGAISALAVKPVGQLPGTHTLVWSGNGVTNGKVTEDCAKLDSMLWVFTSGGQYTLENTQTSHPVLTLVANGVQHQYSPDVDSAQGNFKFSTTYYDPSSISSAKVDYVVISSGNGNMELTISHGCSRSKTEVPEFPTIALPIVAIIGLVFFFQQRKVKGG